MATGRLGRRSLEFRGLPGGIYAVRAVLKGANGVLALAHQEVNVVGSVPER